MATVFHSGSVRQGQQALRRAERDDRREHKQAFLQVWLQKCTFPVLLPNFYIDDCILMD